MKRILIVFGLLACFALPAQIASAYSFNNSLSFEENVEALAAEAGGGYMSLGQQWIGDEYELVQLWGSASGVNILGGNLVVDGFSIVQDVDTGSFKLVDPITGETSMHAAIGESYMIIGTKDAVYSYDGKSLAVKGGSIFFTVDTATGSFVLLAAPLGTYSPSSVPVPAAVWLMGTGLAGIVALRRKVK